MLSALLLPLFLEDAPFLRMPDIHGDRVVFTCEGDLWIGSASTLEATRLTRHSGTEMDARFSPDGTRIAFTAEYDGVREAYVMPAAGGVPRRLTFRHDYAFVQGWTPDGKSVLVRGRSLPRSFGLYQVPANGGPESRLPIEFASHADYAAGGQLLFTRFNRASDAWFHYKGGMQNQIWAGDLADKRFKQLTNAEGTNEYPVAAGNLAVFANERDGMFRLMSVPLAGGQPKTVGAPSDVEIRELGGDATNVVYERGRGIEMAEPATGKVTTLKFRLVSDRMHMLPFRTAPEPHLGAYAISPTGKRVYAEARGQILDLPVGDGEARVWKRQDGSRLRLPKPSPDGKTLAFTSDASGEQQLVVASLDGTGEKALTTDTKRQLVDYQWSPDSKWILLYDSEMRFRIVEVATGKDRLVRQEILNWTPTPYTFSPDSKWIALTQTDPISNQSNLALYEIETGKTTALKHPLAFDSASAFSTDGKYLAFLTRRTFSADWDGILNQMNTAPSTQVALLLLAKGEPNPLALKDPVESADKPEEKGEKKPVSVTIDIDGLYERTVMLPVKAGKYTQVEMVGGRVLLGDGETISAFDLASKTTSTVTSGAGFSVSADGKKLLVGNRVLDVAGKDVPPATGAVKTNGLTLAIEPASEWRQMYWDAWRLLRDYFYVANMNGADWPAIGKKYAVYLDSVRSRDELDILIRWLQSELGSSHEYLSPGDERKVGEGVRGGFLGIDTEPASGKLRIAKVFRGDGLREDERSPLAMPGIDAREGEFLLSVAGQSLDENSDYRSALTGRAGQIVSVVLNDKPTLEGARTVFVKPIANELRMRRLDWVEQNRRYVEKASGGKVGYLYLAAMTGPDVEDFIRQFYPQRNKDALVIDTRFNNGGSTQSILNRILEEKLSGFFNMRASSASWTRNQDYFLGPMACITNEFNVSCGEEFPHRFRDLGLGPVIGRRTYGGEVGSSPGWPLADGGIVSVPNYGMWTTKEGWVIEGPGVSPDIDVPSDPNAYANGTDPQLDKTTEWLLAELKRHPVVQPKQPADPIRARRGGGG